VLARDCINTALTEASDTPDISKRAQMLEYCVKLFRRAMGPQNQRAQWKRMLALPDVQDSLHDLLASLAALTDLLEEVATRGKGLENCWRRANMQLSQLTVFSEEDSPDRVVWFETSKHGFILHSTPMRIADTFVSCMERYRCAWVFTSATLAVGDDFDHFTHEMGIDEARTLLWGSPFDYANNGMLYRPVLDKTPDHRDYTESVVDAALPVIHAAGGRCFVLFTSHRALQNAAAMFEKHGLEYPLLVQGQAPRSQLLAHFRQLGNAVLLGTSSFWEGIDVRGDALSCVIIDKLPFATPDDPVLKARSDAIRAAGGNPFMDHQLPQAVITLKQGAGRLIRDFEDRGVLMLCDPRLGSRAYGKTFLKNMPPMPVTQDVTVVEDFLASLELSGRRVHL